MRCRPLSKLSSGNRLNKERKQEGIFPSLALDEIETVTKDGGFMSHQSVSEQK